jgi:hypothetical protein
MLSTSPYSERQFPGPAAFRGQTLIVAFVSDWSTPSERELVRLRSELRCLSTSLVLMGPEQLRCFQPDDTRRPGAPPSRCEREDFDTLLAPRSRPGQNLKHGVLRLVIVNPNGAIAWSHDGQATGSVVPELISALSHARRHLLLLAGRTYGITRPELMASLTGAFSATFGSDRPLGCLAMPAESREIRDLASGDRV